MGSVSAALLSELAGALAGGGVRVIDLSQTLSPRFPQIVLPPEFDQCAPFRMEEISRYDARGPAWYWNNLSFGEHTGTHFDAPVHWITGRDLPENTTDTIAPASFVGPACVVDCAGEAARDADFLLTADRLRAWEDRHGKISPGSWVLMRTDWSKRADPVAYQNFDETGQHTPGPDVSAVRFWSSSAACSASAPKRSAPTPDRRRISVRPIPVIPSCTARAASGCNVLRIWICCRRSERCSSRHR